MRQALVEHARKQHAEKRGADRQAVTLSHVNGVSDSPEVDMLAVREALDRPGAFAAQQARIVELRFFGGLSIEEAADALGIGHPTVEQEWELARAYPTL